MCFMVIFMRYKRFVHSFINNPVALIDTLLRLGSKRLIFTGVIYHSTGVFVIIKDHVTVDYLEYLKQETMLMCQRENLYQVDLLSPAKVRITDREYWAARRGQAAKTLLFIEENGIKSREELVDLLELASKDKSEKLEKLKATETRLKTVNLLIRYSGQYYANKKVYSDYLKTKNKAQFRAEHDTELTLYEAARRQLKELSDGEKIPTLQHLKEEKETLTVLKNELYEEYSFARAKQKELQTIVANVDKVLSEKDRIDREPTISIE